MYRAGEASGQVLSSFESSSTSMLVGLAEARTGLMTFCCCCSFIVFDRDERDDLEELVSSSSEDEDEDCLVKRLEALVDMRKVQSGS